jgi:hypothetical protein
LFSRNKDCKAGVTIRYCCWGLEETSKAGVASYCTMHIMNVSCRLAGDNINKYIIRYMLSSMPLCVFFFFFDVSSDLHLECFVPSNHVQYIYYNNNLLELSYDFGESLWPWKVERMNRMIQLSPWLICMWRCQRQLRHYIPEPKVTGKLAVEFHGFREGCQIQRWF